MQSNIAEAFQSLFHGRIDVWGSVEGRCNKETVTFNHYSKHLKGEESLGIYPLLNDGSCYFFAIDIDEKDFDKAKAIRQEFLNENIPVYIAESKSKGYHIYGFAFEKFSAKEIRRVANHILNKLNIKAEIFPKQDKVDKVVPYGNYINLPCFGKTRPFLSIQLKEVPLEIAIDKIKYVPQEAIDRLLKTIPEEPPPRKKPPRETPKRRPPCIDVILKGVSEPGRDEAAFALARYYLDQKYSPEDVFGLLKLWDERNKPPLGDERLLGIKVKSAEKGYAFGCSSITDNPMLIKFCVGVEECEWLKEVKVGLSVTIDGITYYQKGSKICSSRPGKKEDALPLISTLSNFSINPKRKIELNGEDERLDTTIKISDREYNILFRKSDFNSRKQLLASIPIMDMQFYGTDRDTQPILTMLNKNELPKYKGTKILGRHENIWVLRDLVISKEGIVEKPDLIYIPSEVSFDRQISYPTTKTKRDDIINIKNRIIPLLLRLNSLETILPILGWFFITPFTPQIRDKLQHFPILSLWGTHGGGKSSLLRLIWRIFGVKAELFSATETPFTFLRLLSGTNSIPIIIDEFKPHTMVDKEISLLIRYLRRIYDGDIEARGRPDLSIVTYHLQAPTIISGEVSPVIFESALTERIIQVNMSPDILEKNPTYIETFNKLSLISLQEFAYPYIKWCLATNIDELINEAAGLLSKQAGELPERIYDNILVMVTGIVALKCFSQIYSPLKPDEQLLNNPENFKVVINQVVNHVIKELFEETGYHIIALTSLLETLSTMAQTGRIKHGIHYTTSDNDTFLYIHLQDCLAEFHRFTKEMGLRIETVDKNAYYKQAHEEQNRKGYVMDTRMTKWFERYVSSEGGKGKLRKAIQINMERLPFDTSGFKMEKTMSESRSMDMNI